MPRGKSDVWEHYNDIDIDGISGVSCNYCPQTFKRPNATKMKRHFNKCKNAPFSAKQLSNSPTSSPGPPKNRKRLTPPSDNEAEEHEQTHNLGLDTTYPDLVSPSQARQKLLKPCFDVRVIKPEPLDPLTNKNYHSATSQTENMHLNEIDVALARAIYASGMPLSTFQSEYWQDAFKIICPDYKLPSLAAIAGSLLDNEYVNVKTCVNQKIGNASALGLIIDRWTTLKGKPVLTFFVSTPDPIFIKSIATSAQEETVEFLAEEIQSVIRELGSSRFVSIITDNTFNTRATRNIIENNFETITCMESAVRTFSDLYENIVKLKSFKNIIQSSITLVKYIEDNHIISLGDNTTSVLKLYSKNNYKFIDTLKWLVDNRRVIEVLSISQDEEMKQYFANHNNSEITWKGIEWCLKILSPVSEAVKRAKSNRTLLSDIPSIFDEIKTTIESQLQEEDTKEFMTTEDEIHIVNEVNKRRDLVLRPIHFAANMLDPRYIGKNLRDNDFSNATDYIAKLSLFLNKDMSQVMTNLAEFRTKSGFWKKSQIWLPVKTLEPSLWWQGLCEGQPITSVAVRILSVSPSILHNERKWSQLAQTHTRIDETFNKLFTICTNLQYMDPDRSENQESMCDSTDEEGE